MADNSGGIGLVGVLIGAVIVIGVAFFFFRGMEGGDAGPDINIEAPSAPSVPSPAK
jgi:hypothetical protein